MEHYLPDDIPLWEGHGFFVACCGKQRGGVVQKASSKPKQCATQSDGSWGTRAGGWNGVGVEFGMAALEPKVTGKGSHRPISCCPTTTVEPNLACLAQTEVKRFHSGNPGCCLTVMDGGSHDRLTQHTPTQKVRWTRTFSKNGRHPSQTRRMQESKLAGRKELTTSILPQPSSYQTVPLSEALNAW